MLDDYDKTMGAQEDPTAIYQDHIYNTRKSTYMHSKISLVLEEHIWKHVVLCCECIGSQANTKCLVYGEVLGGLKATLADVFSNEQVVDEPDRLEKPIVAGLRVESLAHKHDVLPSPRARVPFMAVFSQQAQRHAYLD